MAPAARTPRWFRCCPQTPPRLLSRPPHSGARRAARMGERRGPLLPCSGSRSPPSLYLMLSSVASSHKATGRQPSKRLKREKSSLVKSDLQEPVSRNEGIPLAREQAETSDEDNQDLSVDEESSCKSAESAESELEAADLQKKPLQLDNNAFLDEDSNQPMPVDRFFGNIEFMQDLPAAALPCTAMSRREFRKLHFIAKEDDDDDDVL
uniref:Chromosome 1 open reading frame 174 n=1 Tax=Crocodylus porosus TaxID=8502 RepID=A0A7M4F002_CROPO